jgi:hypothetical protein
VTALVETRVTNTNEVARSCVLRAGFAALAFEFEGGIDYAPTLSRHDAGARRKPQARHRTVAWRLD